MYAIIEPYLLFRPRMDSRARGSKNDREGGDRAREDDRERERGLTRFLRRSFSRRAQGLDHIARQLGDGHEGDANCDVCGAPGDEDAMILCDGCDRGCARCERAREWMTRELFLRSFAREGGARGGGDARERGGDWTRSTVTRGREGEGLEKDARRRTRGGRRRERRETDG